LGLEGWGRGGEEGGWLGGGGGEWFVGGEAGGGGGCLGFGWGGWVFLGVCRCL